MDTVKEIKAIIQSSTLDKVLLALHGMKRLPGCTVSHVHGYQRSDGGPAEQGLEHEERTKSCEEVVKIRTGEKGDVAVFLARRKPAMKR